MHGIAGQLSTSKIRTHANCQETKHKTDSKMCTPLLGVPSGKVTNPKQHSRGEINFNRELAPNNSLAAVPVCKKHVPNIKSEFYMELNTAIESGVRFVLCIVDPYCMMFFDKPEILDLIDFCKDKKMIFYYSNMSNWLVLVFKEMVILSLRKYLIDCQRESPES